MNSEHFDKNMQMLNPEQRRAVETLDGPVMVIAGPWTGKTQIIGMRTANIILKAGVDASNILITTFTEAGVIAIRERLISLIGQDAYKVHVSTIHSFSQDVIASFPEKFTQEKLDTPIDDIESLEIISSIVSEKLKNAELEHLTSYGDTLFYVRAIKSAISNLKREWVSIARFQNIIEEANEQSLAWLEEKRNNKRIKKIEKYEQEHENYIGKLKELHEIFSAYNETLRARHLYDFNDMINFVLEKFRSDEQLQAYYAETYQYIMLDEYQDTNNPQNEIVNLILSYGESKNIMVVGDDDQSIYRFQGANIENMLDFTTLYPEAEIIVLDKNYRSQQWVLDAAAQLIEENFERLINRIAGLKKDLFSQRDFQISPPSLYLALSEIDERIYIRDQILEYIKNGVAPEEIAIITRSNAEVQAFSEFLSDADITVCSKLDSNILENDFVILILELLELIHDPYSNETALVNLLRSSLTDVEALDVIRLNTFLYRANYVKRGNPIQIFDVLKDILHRSDEIGLENPEKFSRFLDTLLEVQGFFAEHNMLLGISHMLKEFKILEYINSHGTLDDIGDAYTLFRNIEWWLKYNTDMQIPELTAKIELYRKYNYSIQRQSLWESDKGVQVMTAHGSKGLEYTHVFIPGLYTGNWDSKISRELIKLPDGIAGTGLQFALEETLSDAEKKKHEKERQMQEDRRLFFVALTRAKQWLHLSFPASIDGKPKIISPFLTELGNTEHIPSHNTGVELGADMLREMLQESKLIHTGTKELEYIENFLKNYKLSASDLNTFLVSPKDFLYRTVYRYPFESNENAVFGTMYHRTLELFYKKILESWEIQDIDYMLYVYECQLEREYLRPEEYKRLKKRWEEALRWYYECYRWSFKAPLKTEYRFSRKNIFFGDIPLTGIIDKIELLDENYSENIAGGTLFSQSIKITDYKTGATKYLGDIKWQDKEGNPDTHYERGRYGRQLMFYKLLFENDPDLRSHYSLGSLELDFCEGKNGNYKRVEVEFSPEEYENFKLLVKNTYAQMTDIQFWKEYLHKES